ncbi:MAG TPA: hypothetical protein PLN69_06880 [bacterium]|nr:hypothetical protein [bacterium]
MAQAAKVLISFIDGSFLYAALSKRVETTDTYLICNKIIGTPEGTAADKPTIANAINRQSKVGTCQEMLIPLARINGISIQEEYIGKDVPTDMQQLWDE